MKFTTQSLLRLVIFCFISTLHVHGQENDDDFAILSAYRDFFSQATDFSLSFARYRTRGYDYRLRTVRWNGVPLENWENGTISWSVIGNLSSISNTTDADNLTTYVSELREGGRLGASVSNRTYTYKASANYALIDKKGWSAAIDVSRRWGQSLSVEGVSADSYSFFATVERKIKNHSIELSLLYAPSERATQRASTAEAYELMGNNLYNPAWGYQSGVERSTRKNMTRQPVAILTHTYKIDDKLTLRNTISARVGTESFTGLTWQNTPNPYPDYYRYMPSYQSIPEAREMVAWAWWHDPTVSQIDFQNLYDTNGYNSPQAKYIIEDRCRDVQQYRIASEIRGGMVSGGFEVMYAENRNYKRVSDLLGGDYWLDIDAFVEQDDDVKDMVQSNLRNPNFRAAVGDIFGYDYSMMMRRASGWAAVQKRWGNYSVRLHGEASAVIYRRRGYFEKENFDGAASLGRSARVNNYDYTITAEGSYSEGGRLRLGALLTYRTLSPQPSQIFISPNYRNATLPQSVKQKVASVELNAEYRSEKTRIKGVLYYTAIVDKTQLLSFYDDNIYTYTNYWMQGIGERYVGLEFSFEQRLTNRLTLSVAAALSDNRYTSNPTATQWSEATGEELRTDERVFYENLRISGSPQSVAVAALKYDNSKFSVSGSVNYFDNSYISITPLRRTERSQSTIARTVQEKLTGGVTLDIFGGKTIYLPHNQSLGLWAGINNILNNRNLRTGGYESTRTVGTTASDSRYYYALGINGFVSITYRF